MRRLFQTSSALWLPAAAAATAGAALVHDGGGGKRRAVSPLRMGLLPNKRSSARRKTGQKVNASISDGELTEMAGLASASASGSSVPPSAVEDLSMPEAESQTPSAETEAHAATDAAETPAARREGQEEQQRSTTDGAQAPSPQASEGVASGWMFEKVDSNFQTELEVAYERNQERIHRIFAEPLILDIPRNDGNWCPDVFLGFSRYDHRRRDEYRQVVARACGVDAKSIGLSAAWSGRFNPGAFPTSRKVLGISIRTGEEPVHVPGTNGRPRGSTSAADAHAATRKEAAIRLLVSKVNAGQCSGLYHMNAASAATDEVEIRPEDPRVARVALHIAKAAVVHRMYVLCFSDTAEEGMRALLHRWVAFAQAVPQYVHVADVLAACGLSTALASSVSEAAAAEPTDSFKILAAALKRLSGGSDVEPTAAVFINGAMLGGPKDVKELLRRKRGLLVTALQRPEDVGFKKNFVHRSRRMRPVLQRDMSVPSAS